MKKEKLKKLEDMVEAIMKNLLIMKILTPSHFKRMRHQRSLRKILMQEIKKRQEMIHQRKTLHMVVMKKDEMKIKLK